MHGKSGNEVENNRSGNDISIKLWSDLYSVVGIQRERETYGFLHRENWADDSKKLPELAFVDPIIFISGLCRYFRGC